MATITIPYENATSGAKARDEITSLLRRLGCESAGPQGACSRLEVHMTKKQYRIVCKSTVEVRLLAMVGAHPYTHTLRYDDPKSWLPAWTDLDYCQLIDNKRAHIAVSKMKGDGQLMVGETGTENLLFIDRETGTVMKLSGSEYVEEKDPDILMLAAAKTKPNLIGRLLDLLFPWRDHRVTGVWRYQQHRDGIRRRALKIGPGYQEIDTTWLAGGEFKD